MATFNLPRGIAVDALGNIYVGDTGNNRIVKLYATVNVTTLAGSGTATNTNGTGSLASFKVPYNCAVDFTGNVYVADSGNNIIRKITSSGVVTTLAGSGTVTYLDGNGTLAGFNNPCGIAVDTSGNVYIGERFNHRIRKITPQGVVTTLAGSGIGTYLDGNGTLAGFNSPFGLTIDSSGNVYVADTTNNRIRKITPQGVVSTFAGSGAASFADGTGTNAIFYNPYGVYMSPTGILYVADTLNNRVRQISSTQIVTTLAGSGTATYLDSVGTLSGFNYPNSITVDNNNIIYVTDLNNNRIRSITSAGIVTTLTGSGIASFANGTGTNSSFNAPWGICVDIYNNLYIGDSTNNMIRKITPLSTQTTVNVLTPSSNALLPATNQSAFTVKYNSAGISQWAVALNSVSSNNGASVATDSNGNVYMAGTYSSGTNTIYQNQTVSPLSVIPSSSNAAFGMKISSNGIPQWIVSIDSISNDSGLGCTVDLNGNLYIAGSYGGNSAVIYNSNGSSNNINLPAYSNLSSFIVKYNSNGVSQWMTTIGGASNIANSITIDNSNNIYITGSYTGNPNIYNSSNNISPLTFPTPCNNLASFVVKYDSNGVPLSAFGIIGTSNNVANSIAVNPSGTNIVVGGYITGSTTTLYDGNNIASPLTFPAGITTQAAYVANYNLKYSSNFYLSSSLGNVNNGQQKYITNIGPSNITLNVTSSNNSTILNTYNIAPSSNVLFNWFGGNWYKFI
jgi:sugar lactone lactonase YvrE